LGKGENKIKSIACTIDFEPIGKWVRCHPGETVADCASRSGIGLNSICGGLGTCHSCKTQIISGHVSEHTQSELKFFTQKALKEGWRLACQVYPAGNCKIMIPAESMTSSQRVQVEGLALTVKPEPPIQAYLSELDSPSLLDPQADVDRLLTALKTQFNVDCDKYDIAETRALPDKLRSLEWKCQAVIRNNELIHIMSRKSTPLGLAIDLGSTKIAGYLVDMTTGKTLSSKGCMNPQISYGEDIITRITNVVHSRKDGPFMQKLAVEGIAELCADLCKQSNVETEDIVETVVVGNTAMHHLFLGLPVKQLALSPFIPVVNREMEVKASDLGLHFASGAYVYLLPNIAGFVGADHVAVLLATRTLWDEGLTLILDIGTNTEVSLVTRDKIVATSCASGPAFEGGHIKFGMRAAAGAIEKFLIVKDEIKYQTINNEPPIGICGSGILDVIAQLYINGIVDASGKLMIDHNRVRDNRGQKEFIIVDSDDRSGRAAVTITQKDIRELQLAKAAIRSGIQALLETGGHSECEIAKVIIAGAFGSYIDIANAIEIGLLPSLPLHCFQQVGNAAGLGARLALISLPERESAKEIVARVQYLELSGAPGFNKTFLEASYFGRYILKNGKREKNIQWKRL
jgi:uncharacterized 2Fe-2S/4Fe-4S cluster protein (DUF4445 family)